MVGEAAVDDAVFKLAVIVGALAEVEYLEVAGVAVVHVLRDVVETVPIRALHALGGVRHGCPPVRRAALDVVLCDGRTNDTLGDVGEIDGELVLHVHRNERSESDRKV